jgi:ech hydrogenase subunit D
MYIESQPVTAIQRSELVAKAAQMRAEGYRLVQISCLLKDDFELSYSFDKGYRLVTLRFSVPRADATVPSITATYLAAFTYENELQDLFGLKVTDLALNFNGTFYRTSIKTPFAVPKTQEAAQ